MAQATNTQSEKNFLFPWIYQPDVESRKSSLYITIFIFITGFLNLVGGTRRESPYQLFAIIL